MTFLMRFCLLMYSKVRRKEMTADVRGECARLFASSSSAYSYNVSTPKFPLLDARVCCWSNFILACVISRAFSITHVYFMRIPSITLSDAIGNTYQMQRATTLSPSAVTRSTDSWFTIYPRENYETSLTIAVTI